MGCVPSSSNGQKPRPISSGYIASDLQVPEFESVATVFVENDEEEVEEVSVENQGVSLRFLWEFINDEVEARLGKDTSAFETVKVVKKVVMPMTESRQCTVVEITKPAERGRVTHFISHAWNAPFSTTTTAIIEELELWEQSTGKKAYFWMDVFAVNQHKMAEKEYSQDDINEMLSRAMSCASTTLACLHPWRKPVYIERAWCLYEANTALVQCQKQVADDGRVRRPSTGHLGRPRFGAHRPKSGKGKHELKFVLSAETREEFEREALAKNFESVLQALADISVEEATSYKPEDKEMILEFIDSSPGGSDALNQNVTQSIRRWLVNSGRQIVEKRKRTHMNTAHLALILVNFARLLTDQAETHEERKEAQELFEEALSIDKSQLELSELGGTSEVLEVEKRNIARDQFMLGLCLYDMKNYKNALKCMEEAREIYEAIQDELSVARVLTRTGPIHMKLSQYDEASDDLRQADAIFRSHATDSEGNSKEIQGHSECLGFLAYLIAKLPEKAIHRNEAIEIRRKVLKLREKQFGPQHPDVGMALSELASSESAAQNYEDATLHYERSLNIYRKMYGEDHAKTKALERKLMSTSAAANMQKRASKKVGILAAQQAAASAAKTWAKANSETPEEVADVDAVEGEVEEDIFLPVELSSRTLI